MKRDENGEVGRMIVIVMMIPMDMMEMMMMLEMFETEINCWHNEHDKGDEIRMIENVYVATK